MYKLLRASMAFLMLTAVGNAQTPNVIPSSPQSQLFEKYVNYQVSLYDGIPDIEIPLYNIQVNGINIPINLSYHASGIKYLQYDGSVAVGWSLNPGYRISRSIHGKPDELCAMPLDSIDKITNVYDPMNGGYGNDRALAPFVLNYDNPQLTNPINSVYYDGEYDLFTYMLPTGSGHFIITDREVMRSIL